MPAGNSIQSGEDKFTEILTNGGPALKPFEAQVMTSGEIRSRLARLAALACLLAMTSVAAFAATPQVENGFSFAAGGDLLGPYQTIGQVPDDALQAVATHFRQADMGFANMEGSIFNLSSFRGWPAAETGGGYPLAPEEVGKDLRNLGITVVSKANNHATDFGTEGLVATLESLKKAGIAQAGAGMNLAAARAPVYLRTSKGTAALVDVASTFTPMSVAGQLARYGRFRGGRPGLSALHVREVHLLPQSQFDKLRNLLDGMHVSSREQSWSGELGKTVAGKEAGQDLVIGDAVFRASSSAGLTWEMNSQDLRAVLDNIRLARRKANFVLFSIHAHEITPFATPAQGDNNNTARPTDFERTLFHKAIDAGADAVVRNGPHELGGIEIYKGKPIFYSLGSLFFQFGGERSYQVPGGDLVKFPDEWFQTVVPVTTYEHGQVSEIRLYPITIESSKSSTDGRPRPADPMVGRQILERVAALSAPYGTKIKIVDNIGIIEQPEYKATHERPGGARGVLR